ncbi:hypothetical protein BDW22DRAFT_1361765 [Trametopsis cervina]|nr:hypothetical protein BDW22DRAFT_1361765 [Trametopsis cervina]
MPEYVDKVIRHLPQDLKTQAQSLPAETLGVVDTILRFALGEECPPDGVSDDTRKSWTTQQQALVPLLRGNRVEKRTRDQEEGSSENTRSAGDAEQTTKKPRLQDAEDVDDTHVFTLKSLSVSSPLRKKVDITVHTKSLRLVNPSTEAIEFSVPLTEIKRAFLIPTRGKAKPHWTVVLLSADTSSPASTAKGKAKAAPANDVVFGVDAVPTTAYATSEGPQAKGTPIFATLRTFLSHLPPHVAVTEVGLELEQSKAKGVQAYRRAKEGTLWFLSEGVLWDGKPCEFWDVADLVGSVPGGEEGDVNGPTATGTEGIRVVSATGRTCSVFLRRRLPALETEAESGDDEEAFRAEETDFGMIDGKEQDGILQWVRRHKKRFGAARRQQPQVDPSTSAADASAGNIDVKGKGRAVAPPSDDSDDEDDEDFVGSESDDGSPTSSSGSEAEDGDEAQSGGEASDDEQDGSTGDEDGEDSRPPLGSKLALVMPRMSKAAIDAAVEMVTGDLLGVPATGTRGAPMQVDEDEDDDGEDDENEEDQLDD